MPRPVGMTLEPVEHLVLDVGCNAWPEIGHRENDTALVSSGTESNRRIVRRKSDRVGKKIIQHLHHAAAVGDEVPDGGIDIELEGDAVAGEAVLYSLRRIVDG